MTGAAIAYRAGTTTDASAHGSQAGSYGNASASGRGRGRGAQRGRGGGRGGNRVVPRQATPPASVRRLSRRLYIIRIVTRRNTIKQKVDVLGGEFIATQNLIFRQD
jgi:hypothetical protein